MKQFSTPQRGRSSAGRRFFSWALTLLAAGMVSTVVSLAAMAFEPPLPGNGACMKCDCRYFGGIGKYCNYCKHPFDSHKRIHPPANTNP